MWKIINKKGPYINRWASTYAKLFLAQCDDGIVRTYFIGLENEALMHPTLRDAKSYLRDNGFVIEKA